MEKFQFLKNNIKRKFKMLTLAHRDTETGYNAIAVFKVIELFLKTFTYPLFFQPKSIVEFILQVLFLAI